MGGSGCHRLSDDGRDTSAFTDVSDCIDSDQSISEEESDSECDTSSEFKSKEQVKLFALSLLVLQCPSDLDNMEKNFMLPKSKGWFYHRNDDYELNLPILYMVSLQKGQRNIEIYMIRN